MKMPLEPDHYFEGPYMVFTEIHHLSRGYCCGSRCRHCPFEPCFKQGATRVRESGSAPLLDTP